MKHALGAIVALFVVATSSSIASGQAGGALTSLFDGKTLNGWNQIGNANWEVADGAMQANKGNGFLVTPASYKDFQIVAEFWVSDDANSGIFIRCSDPKTINAMNAYEVNIYDQRPEPIYGTGGIVNVAKVDPMPKAGGKWNTYEITAKGSQLTVVLNGVKTAEAQDSKHAQGPFALQFGNGPKDAPGGVIKWRKVQIKPL